MKKLFVVMIFVLCGCAKETPVNHMADNIRDELTAIAEEVYMLPPECGDQAKLAQRIELTRERVDIMEETYANETSVLVNEKRRLERCLSFVFIMFIIAATLWVRRLLTRVVQ